MEQLKMLRLSHKLTQQEVANILGVDRTTYVKYETGKSEPTFETLVRLADYFDVSTDYLLGTSSAPSRPSSSGVQIPVLGDVRAGLPIEAVENIIDYEEISAELARSGEYFALRIVGDSMEPRIREGDVVSEAVGFLCSAGGLFADTVIH